MTDQLRRRRSVLGATLGVSGEVLITAGVLLGLFLTWELWWTNVAATHAQARTIAALGWAYDPNDHAPAPAAAPEDRYLTPSKLPPKVDKEPTEGTTFATIYVPRFAKNYARTITEGIDKHTVLDVKGVGHYPGTGMPGAVGNFAVAGHRTTFGKPFNKIDTLRVGDPVIIQTKDGWYVYAVTGHVVVEWYNGEQVAPVPGDTTGTKKPTERLLTMTSCHPVWQPDHRYVLHGKLVYWAPPDGDKVPQELVTGRFAAGVLAAAKA